MTTSAAGRGGGGGGIPAGREEKPPFEVEPGMVRIQQWRPDSEIQAKSAAAMWGGVGRKP